MRLFAVLSSVRIRTRTPKPWQSSSTIHHLRELKYSIEDGLGDFLPPAALKTVALDYQQGLLDRLNDEVRGECRVCVCGFSIISHLQFHGLVLVLRYGRRE